MIPTITYLYEHPWWIAVAALVAILGVGRLSRVITYDVFPPAAWLRAWWSGVTHDGPWAKLLHCFWCFTPWLMLAALAWFALATLAVWLMVAWWVFWGWLALSYVASIIIARDEPADHE